VQPVEVKMRDICRAVVDELLVIQHQRSIELTSEGPCTGCALAHGARVRVESGRGRSTTFTVVWPRDSRMPHTPEDMT
jgi:signal transduction histidine kinase